MPGDLVAELSLINDIRTRVDGSQEWAIPTELTVNGRGSNPARTMQPTTIVVGVRLTIEPSPGARDCAVKYGLEGPGGELSHIWWAHPAMWPDWFRAQLSEDSLSGLPDHEMAPLPQIQVRANEPGLILFPAALTLHQTGIHTVHAMVDSLRLRTTVDIKYRRLPDVYEPLG